MAVHVSPAFRVELGDTVTVGAYPISSAAGDLPLIKCQVNAGLCQKLSDSTCYGCQRARHQPSRLASSEAPVDVFASFGILFSMPTALNSSCLYVACKQP